MTTEISGSALGVDVNAAIQAALKNGDEHNVYELSNIQIWPSGFIGLGRETIVTLQEVTPTSEAVSINDQSISFTKDHVKDVAAWWNVMPGGPPALHVKGRVDLNEKNYAINIEFDGYEQIFPPNLLLKLSATKLRCPGEDRGDFHFNKVPSIPGSIGLIKLLVPEGDPFVIEEIGIAH